MSDGGIGRMMLFVGMLIAAAVIAGVLIDLSLGFSTVIDGLGSDAQSSMGSNINIISDTQSDAIYDHTDEELTVLLQNNGSSRIDIDTMVLMVNGQFVPMDTVELLNREDDEVFRPNDVMRITGDVDLDDGEHTVVVTTPFAKDVLIFYTEE